MYQRPPPPPGPPPPFAQRRKKKKKRARGQGKSSKALAGPSQREEANWEIHRLFTQHDHDECLAVIERQLVKWNGNCEFPVYVKALIMRQQGHIQESLQLFQAAVVLNPQNPLNLKQVARSLFLLGKHKEAVQVYDEALRLDSEDWEVLHNKGLCFMFLKDYEKAVELFELANEIAPHTTTFLKLAKVHSLRGAPDEAIEALQTAKEYEEHNPEILTQLGLLMLRHGSEPLEGFSELCNALNFDPSNVKAILGAGAFMQEQGDPTHALPRYRVAAKQLPNAAQLWNNIGMAYFQKSGDSLVLAISCLKKALYLDPFQWIIAYNLGLAYLHRGQYASAFHFMSCAINLKPDLAEAYMCLAVALTHLEDVNNALHAYEKAVDLQPTEPSFHLNFAIALYKAEDHNRAAEELAAYDRIVSSFDEGEMEALDVELPQMADTLREKLGE